MDSIANFETNFAKLLLRAKRNPLNYAHASGVRLSRRRSGGRGAATAAAKRVGAAVVCVGIKLAGLTRRDKERHSLI